MESNLINTREDLDAIHGTPAHAEAMALLAGTLWRLEKDDAAGAWRAVEDDSTIARFGFTRANFPKATPPALPIYAAPPPPTAPRLAQLRAVRERMLDRLSSIAGRADRKGDTATAAACDDAAVALLDITKDLPLDLPGMEALVVARYGAIVTTALTAAPGLASAFAGVDL